MHRVLDMRQLFGLVAAIGTLHVTGSAAGAECITTDVSIAKRNAAIVVEGTVKTQSDLAPGRVMIQVDANRVWKGDAKRTMTFVYARTAEGPSLKVGDRRVFFARPPTAADTVSPSGPTFHLLTCVGAMLLEPSEISKLGRSRPPSDR